MSPFMFNRIIIVFILITLLLNYNYLLNEYRDTINLLVFYNTFFFFYLFGTVIFTK